MPDASPLFEFAGVGVRGDGRWRLRGVDAVVPDRGITALVGPSGSGKSTMLRCCNRLEVPDEGSVRFRGAEVATTDVLALRRRVGMVFQRPTPFPGTGLDNLRVADPTMTSDAGEQVLARVGLAADFLARDAMSLSGGEAQRLCLARSLTAQPEVLLMDEVTSSLDASSRNALEDLARMLCDDGVPLLWVTHDFAQVTRVATTVLVVIDGRVAHAGPLEQLGVGAPTDVLDFLREASGAE
ncbi:MAG TPA: phosphate ABC transporter ATP-binding protein [Acidimicrobiia bacterium]|nr:phosphate ABC transporter ATP-binding protein [Acidimicrobiia bacterium]